MDNQLQKAIDALQSAPPKDGSFRSTLLVAPAHFPIPKFPRRERGSKLIPLENCEVIPGCRIYGKLEFLGPDTGDASCFRAMRSWLADLGAAITTTGVPPRLSSDWSKVQDHITRWLLQLHEFIQPPVYLGRLSGGARGGSNTIQWDKTPTDDRWPPAGAYDLKVAAFCEIDDVVETSRQLAAQIAAFADVEWMRQVEDGLRLTTDDTTAATDAEGDPGPVDPQPTLKELHIKCLRALRSMRARSKTARRTATEVARKIDQLYNETHVKTAMADLAKWGYVDSRRGRPPKGTRGGSFITESGLTELQKHSKR